MRSDLILISVVFVSGIATSDVCFDGKTPHLS